MRAVTPWKPMHEMETMQRRMEDKKEDKDYTYQEVRYGKFSRMMTLPDGVDAEQIKANYKDGVLEISMPAPTQMSSKDELFFRFALMTCVQRPTTRMRKIGTGKSYLPQVFYLGNGILVDVELQAHRQCPDAESDRTPVPGYGIRAAGHVYPGRVDGGIRQWPVIQSSRRFIGFAKRMRRGSTTISERYIRI